ncbi:MAG: type ISP restriction/modification enzyme [Candidatus Sulfotelmatobacter sp.]
MRELHEIRSSGEATDETSYYTPLNKLLDEIGNQLKPKVRCILTLRNRGAGHPDGGLFTTDQFQRLTDLEPLAGQHPARGAVEVKPTSDDAWITAESEQVTKYWTEYGQVLVTNYRDFLPVGRDKDGKPIKLESFRLAHDEREFWQLTAHPKKAEGELGSAFVEYLKRVMLSNASLTSPKDLAWFLASYARTAKARIDQKARLTPLDSIRSALEEALGLAFKGQKGEHFFRSSLIQTIFYGIFSAWVLWSKQYAPDSREYFRWREAGWWLRVPMIRALFDQVVTASRLEPLGIVEVLDWTESTLNRVERQIFFQKFQEQEAVQYFYEPFLEAFDPELRKELGVWYTPSEIVRYMVARTDRVLREELNIDDGLADSRVIVLDPACGTGAYLVEVLRTIFETLKAKGGDALVGADVKQAAMERVFGFEILPAPFVISHLQIGLLLQHMGAPLADSNHQERAGVYLTNSLTGWEPPEEPKPRLPLPEFEDEREAATDVKQHKDILVIIGNPPYDGFADVAIEEERGLSDAYRTTKHAPAPEGQGLNDLYVRFYRMAERRIVEQTGEGIVCFISNYSWLDGRSHTGMRERYLEAFKVIWVDNLHGDRIISERTSDGQTSETIFALRGKSPGIKLGTAIGLLVAGQDGAQPEQARLLYRDVAQARAIDRRAALLTSLERSDFNAQYTQLEPVLAIGLPFKPREMGRTYLDWPLLIDLFPKSFPGVKTSRDTFLVHTHLDTLQGRLSAYLDPEITQQEMRRLAPEVMASTRRFNAETVRDYLRHRSEAKGRIVKYQYRPFDLRWLYWDEETKLLDEKRSDYFHQAKPGNIWMSAGQRNRKEDFYQPQVTTVLADHHIVESNAAMFPLYIYPERQARMHDEVLLGGKPNLSLAAESYLRDLSAEPVQLLHHTLAILHAPHYCVENAGALRQDWPRVPLPATADDLVASDLLGSELSALLDSDTQVKGVTSGTIRKELRILGNIAAVDGGQVNPGPDLQITVGWGRADREGRISAGQGRILIRPYSQDELQAIGDGALAMDLSDHEALLRLGSETCDVYLNDRVYWKSVPTNVWQYTIGGYPAIKKWLSYRESKLLQRNLLPQELADGNLIGGGRPITEQERTQGKLLDCSITADEAREFTHIVRRVAAILLLQPKLDANYDRIKKNVTIWQRPAPVTDGTKFDPD